MLGTENREVFAFDDGPDLTDPPNSTVGCRRGGRELESAEVALSCIDVLLGGCNAADSDRR